MADSQKKLQAASYFIKNTPINEVKFSLNDVQTLLNDNNTFNTAIQTQMLHDYNVTQYVQIDLPEGRRMITTPYNEVNAKSYYDPVTNSVYEVDHLKSVVISQVGTHQPTGQESFRQQVQQALDAYVKRAFKGANTKVRVVGQATINNNQLVVCISAINSNLSAFWTGNWRCTYKLDLNGSNKVTGDIKVNVHYFEDGNVQLDSDFTPTFEVKAQDAQDIVAQIEKVESDFCAKLESIYLDMPQKTIKQLRRALPISQTKFNWETAAHSVASEFAGRK